jgi:hypothetical protein
MQPSELEHLIRAAGSIANVPEIVVIGSQSVLGQKDREFTHQLAKHGMVPEALAKIDPRAAPSAS